MRLVTGQRSVVMSVGEFAAFSPSPTGGSYGRTGAWRAAAGTAWHQTMRERTTLAEPGAQFEVSLQGRLLHQGWSVELQGRVDQIVPQNGGLVLREIKTISESLPRSEEELEESYPEYFRQLAAYLRLAELGNQFKGKRLAGELVFIDYSTGIVQTVPVPLATATTWLEPQLDALRRYWEFRWNSRQRLAEMPERSAFAILRPGQAEAQADLAAIAGRTGVFMFEAPTGFGKTGLLLEYALARLREGHFQRLLYLTGKGTGQGPVIQQLRALLGREPELSFIQLRSRAEHAIESPLHTCDVRRSCREELEERWQAAGLDPYALFEDGTLPVEKARRLGAATGVCPYEITRAALPCAEVWVCDYNYVFSPAHRSVLFNLQGFDAMSTLLLLDEAHNLPARAAEARSHTFSAPAALFATHALREVQARPVLQRAADDLAEFLEKLAPMEKLDATETYILEDHLENLAAELTASPLPESLPESAMDFLWSGVNALETLHDHSLQLLPTVPARGELRLACVDAAPAIASALRSFGQSVLTSATFGPPEFFASACGLDKHEAHWIAAHAPWRDGAYDVAVDARVDTRMRARERFHVTTAETVRLFADGQARPIAVFFPSYDYAETIRAYVEAMDPGLRINVQPRGVSLTEQTEFLNESLLTAHAIFLVLGGSFAEGIDRLGGEVERAMVVGPALPEPNAVKKAQLARYEETMEPEEAFRRAYLAPGLLKVAQALGRLVRAPGQKAKVLLHCRRFADEATQALLPPEYRGGAVLRQNMDLLEWLKK